MDGDSCFDWGSLTTTRLTWGYKSSYLPQTDLALFVSSFYLSYKVLLKRFTQQPMNYVPHPSACPFEKALVQCSKWDSARAQQLCMIRWPFLSPGLRTDGPSDPPSDRGRKEIMALFKFIFCPCKSALKVSNDGL